MECALIQPELVLYHFGTIEPASREAVESHLLACRDCLEGYIALKRHLEDASGATGGPRPSERARLRLRAEVQREFERPRLSRVTWRRAASWGIAAAAAAAIAFVALRTTEPPPAPPPLEDGSGIPVDSANPGAAGLAVL